MAFEPRYEAFQPRTIWSLSNAFTSAFKELDPIPQFRLRQSWGNFFKPDSRSRSNTGSGTGRLPLSRKTETIDHVWIMFADVHLLDSFCCSAMNLGDADFTRNIAGAWHAAVHQTAGRPFRRERSSAPGTARAVSFRSANSGSRLLLFKLVQALSWKQRRAHPHQTSIYYDCSGAAREVTSKA